MHEKSALISRLFAKRMAEVADVAGRTSLQLQQRHQPHHPPEIRLVEIKTLASATAQVANSLNRGQAFLKSRLRRRSRLFRQGYRSCPRFCRALVGRCFAEEGEKIEVYSRFGAIMTDRQSRKVMSPERWRQIDGLYLTARDLDPDRRLAFLVQACGEDAELIAKVQSMLECDGAENQILDLPAAGLLAESQEAPVTTGTALGPYKVEALLGAGGMGQVFEAVDTRLGRKVAIKVAHERFSASFSREAQAIATLNHPHICALYDLGPNYLVMELVEGETLAAKLKKGSLSIEHTLRYGAQIAEALAEAHAKGIVHRDLKPANIMIAKTGAKVLDFGLAKSAEDASVTDSMARMGTPAYMAPEQMDRPSPFPRSGRG